MKSKADCEAPRPPGFGLVRAGPLALLDLGTRHCMQSDTFRYNGSSLGMLYNVFCETQARSVCWSIYRAPRPSCRAVRRKSRSISMNIELREDCMSGYFIHR